MIFYMHDDHEDQTQTFVLKKVGELKFCFDDFVESIMFCSLINPKVLLDLFAMLVGWLDHSFWLRRLDFLFVCWLLVYHFVNPILMKNIMFAFVAAVSFRSRIVTKNRVLKVLFINDAGFN